MAKNWSTGKLSFSGGGQGPSLECLRSPAQSSNRQRNEMHDISTIFEQVIYQKKSYYIKVNHSSMSQHQPIGENTPRPTERFCKHHAQKQQMNMEAWQLKCQHSTIRAAHVPMKVATALDWESPTLKGMWRSGDLKPTASPASEEQLPLFMPATSQTCGHIDESKMKALPVHFQEQARHDTSGFNLSQQQLLVSSSLISWWTPARDVQMKCNQMLQQ